MNKYKLSLELSFLAGILATLGAYAKTDPESKMIMFALGFWFIIVPITIFSLIFKKQCAKEFKGVKYWDTITSILFIAATLIYSEIQYYPEFFKLLYGNLDNFLKAITPILIIVPIIQTVVYVYTQKNKSNS